jgi:hypothetical protein
MQQHEPPGNYMPPVGLLRHCATRGRYNRHRPLLKFAVRRGVKGGRRAQRGKLSVPTDAMATASTKMRAICYAFVADSRNVPLRNARIFKM